MATKRWMVDYRLKGDVPGTVSASGNSHYMVGPFFMHELAERTLVALANNPAFRGGDIRQVRDE